MNSNGRLAEINCGLPNALNLRMNYMVGNALFKLSQLRVGGKGALTTTSPKKKAGFIYLNFEYQKPSPILKRVSLRWIQ
ncbi:MAG: hypothetical protein OdinLCB4_002225 [Candidatus Odinarchaeum yellowstonii]|uniref:Uncharacterized protein n=1 Tax=Odinarchaeota yellowstonii (strain LCB_4) TaxID=1841599 RepID=A0AAF0D346_ODILC|nr:MAG: hypothetical protein OdinLCB4_002225 [Candidatus Odinarchaeum yellowstonii]